MQRQHVHAQIFCTQRSHAHATRGTAEVGSSAALSAWTILRERKGAHRSGRDVRSCEEEDAHAARKQQQGHGHQATDSGTKNSRLR
eukprot:2690663-Pleurochrysis_carterae.AAC.1